MNFDDEPISDDMLPAERKERLLDWLNQNMAATNQELSRLFGTSVSTIRRDLDQLASQGLVRRTHGGAVRVRRQATWEFTIDLARQTATEEKRAIAQEAIKRIEPHQSILIDTGSTMHEFARAIAALSIPLTIVTNDVLVASTLANTHHIKLVVPGGACRDGAYTLFGEPGLTFIRDLRCDTYFASAQALNAECISDTTVDTVNLKRAMINAANQVVLLIDSSRFGGRAMYRVADVSEISEIITDDGVSEEDTAAFAARNTKLTRVAIGESVAD
ncbi:DeoR/GlpR transcriptional regulator [Arsenicitalea aurantiaca]|uniref:DeoR/GlpR transcriptional regulator n=1 Tax=Arsenicitalea aurantiaca TaxID=1783274 RepID=A0A433X784_9HYPH|nr:DeoR/GlpR family DNA-binding transcription regulator [Arsenicitalea aurantiaca]RUT29946.1 DeoR/GlpR transcriptional regulator [Arsenicitalea aurantiaca]